MSSFWDPRICVFGDTRDGFMVPNIAFLWGPETWVWVSRFWGGGGPVFGVHGGILTQLGTGEVDGPTDAEQRHLSAALLQREVLSNLHILGGNWGVLGSKASLFWGVGMGWEEGNGNKPQRPQICAEMGSQTQQN